MVTVGTANGLVSRTLYEEERTMYPEAGYRTEPLAQESEGELRPLEQTSSVGEKREKIH